MMEDLRKELEEAKAKIAEIEKQLTKEESGVWKPKHGERYWNIEDTGTTVGHIWDDDRYDNGSYTIGNCFRTKEETKFALEKLKVIAELKKYAEPKNREWDGKNYHYYLCYSTADREIKIDLFIKHKLPIIFFESIEKAYEAFNAVGEDRIKKYYLEVDD